MSRIDRKKVLLALPYCIAFLLCDRCAFLWRRTSGLAAARLVQVMDAFGDMRIHPFLSLHPVDFTFGLIGAGLLWIAVYWKSKQRKKFRHGEE